jgi:hypothetical protein
VSREPKRLTFAPSSQDVLTGMRQVAQHCEPRDLPRRPADAISPRELREMLRAGQTSPAAVSTAQWHRAYAEAVQDNAGRFSAALWACDEYHRCKNRPPEMAALGIGLATWLIRFGHNGMTPPDAAGRRRVVEAYVTAQMGRIW